VLSAKGGRSSTSFSSPPPIPNTLLLYERCYVAFKSPRTLRDSPVPPPQLPVQGGGFTQGTFQFCEARIPFSQGGVFTPSSLINRHPPLRFFPSLPLYSFGGGLWGRSPKFSGDCGGHKSFIVGIFVRSFAPLQCGVHFPTFLILICLIDI